MSTTTANGTTIHNDTHARTWLDDIADRVDAEIPKLEAKRDMMLAEVQNLNDQITKARKMLGVVYPDQKKPPKRESRRNRTTQVGRVKLQRVANAILRDYTEEDRFSVIEVHERVFGDSVTIATTRSAFKVLRETEFIGRAGQSHKPNKRQLWRIIDRDAFKNHTEGANASQE
jgi:hypothetical protein